MEDEDDDNFQVFPGKHKSRKGFASRYEEEQQEDMDDMANEAEDDIANEAMDSDDEDQDEATTADPSDVNAEAPDDDYEADPVEVVTDTSHMDEPMDEPMDEEDVTGNLAKNFGGCYNCDHN